MLKLACATKCSILYIHPQLLSQDSQHFTLTLTVLPGVAVPHLEREALLQGGTTALEPWHCRDLSDRWGWGYLYLSPFSPTSLFSLPLIHLIQEQKSALLSLLHWWPWAPKHSPLIFPSILERKRSQTQLESRSFDSPTQKSTWFTFWPAVVFITLGALLLAG